MNIQSALFSFAIVAMLQGCQSAATSNRGQQIPNIDSLITISDKSMVSIRKISELNGKVDSVLLRDNSLKETLSTLSRLTVMNKPVFADGYSKTQKPDTKSNLYVTRWETNNPDNPVKFFELYQHSEMRGWFRAEALIHIDNLLFKKEERISIGFDPISQRVEKIDVSGWQQMMMAGEDKYAVKIQLIYE